LTRTMAPANGGNGSKDSTTGGKSSAKDSNSSVTQSQLDQVRRNLVSHRLFMNEKTARNLETIRGKAKKIATDKRGSTLSIAEQKKFAEMRDKMEWRNEADFVEVMMNIVRLNSRHKRPPEGKENDDDAWILESWDASGLELTRRQPLITNCIPTVDTTGNPILANLLSLLPRVMRPEPDHAYGLSDSLFSEEERAILDSCQDFTRISKYIYHTFFIIEFKGCGHSIQEADLQACRADLP